MNTTYELPKQLAIGRNGEVRLDKYYGKWFDIRPVSRELERIGIDRIFISKDPNNKMSTSVQYKSDDRAAKSDNMFLETISVDTKNILGWAYTLCAQVIIYFVPPHNTAYRLTALTLKNLVPVWVERYGNSLQSIKNTDSRGEIYFTKGILVPLAELSHNAFKIDDIP